MPKVHTEVAGSLNGIKEELTKKKPNRDAAGKAIRATCKRIAEATGLPDPKGVTPYEHEGKPAEAAEAAIAEAHTCCRNDDLSGCRLVLLSLLARVNGKGKGGKGGKGAADDTETETETDATT